MVLTVSSSICLRAAPRALGTASSAARRFGTTRAHVLPTSASRVASGRRSLAPKLAAASVVAAASAKPLVTSCAASMLTYEAVDADGNNVDLSKYEGQVVLVVNVASK